MRFMIIRKADKDTEAGVMPTEALLVAMTKYNQEMVDAGIMRAGEGLHPSSNASRIRFVNGKPTVVDGPFTETKELIAGFTIIEVASKEEALAWVRRWPVEDANGNVELELRQVFADDDFGSEFTPELRAQEEQMRQQIAAASKPLQS